MAKPVSAHDRMAVLRTTKLCAETWQIYRPLIFLPTRCSPNVVAARQMSQYLAHVSAGVSISALARIYNRHMTTITFGLQKIEDMRDEESFEKLVQVLEEKYAAHPHHQA
jgi:chromosomal replication initiation ATPase DnaA